MSSIEQICKRCDRLSYAGIFRQPDFPLTVNRINIGYGPNYHEHERFYEMVLVIAGHAQHVCEGAGAPLHAKQVMVIPPGVRHTYASCEFFDYYNVIFDLEWLRPQLLDLPSTAIFQQLYTKSALEYLNEHHRLPVLDLNQKSFDACAEICSRLHGMMLFREPGYQFGMCSLLSRLLQVTCQAGGAKADADERGGSHVNRDVRNIVMELSHEMSEKWSVQRICKTFHVSRSVLFREFEAYCQQSPMAFLNRCRLNEARNLLIHSDCSMETVARQCGFSSSSYFSSMFTRWCGVSPLKYRQNTRRNE